MHLRHHTNRSKSYLPVWLLAVGIFVLYLILNCLTPLWCDDLDYAHEGHTLRDIFRRETFDYLHANGRIFSHSVVQFFAGILGKPVFNPVNAFLTTVLICMIPCVASNDDSSQRTPWKLFLLVSASLFLVWFVIPDQYITMFMIAGSSNYIWGCILNLLFINIFATIDECDETSRAKYGLFILLALFAGAWMEMYSIAILPAAFAFSVLHGRWRNPKRAGLFLAYAFGTAIVVLAPGNFVRQAQLGPSRPELATWIVNILEIALQSRLFWVWIISLVVLLYRMIHSDYSFKKFLSETLLFQVALLVSLLFILVSGVNSTRALWGVFIFSFIIFFQLIKGLDIHPAICLAVSVCFLLPVIIGFSNELSTAKEKNHSVREMITAMEEKSLVEGKYFLWPAMDETRKTIPDPTGKDGNWPGEYIARYYHAEPFSLVPEEPFLYCQSQRQADSLYLDVLPIVGKYAVLVSPNRDDKATVRFSYTDKPFYVMRSRIRRILSAFGLKRLATVSAENPRQGFFGRLFWEKWDKEAIVLDLPKSSSLFYVHDDSLVISMPFSRIRPEFDNKLTECTIE